MPPLGGGGVEKARIYEVNGVNKRVEIVTPLISLTLSVDLHINIIGKLGLGNKQRTEVGKYSVVNRTIKSCNQ